MSLPLPVLIMASISVRADFFPLVLVMAPIVVRAECSGFHKSMERPKARTMHSEALLLDQLDAAYPVYVHLVR